MAKEILNIGILAHVDAGKTTLTENMLFKVGATRSKGSVDDGSTITDSLAIERKRGISVKTATASFEFNAKQINIIDTPGHADFTAEVERCLSILDGAVLVVSAVEGVQAHTYSLYDSLKSLNIPTIIVVNKIDRQGADFENVLHELSSELGVRPFPLHGVKDEGLATVNFSSIWDDTFKDDALNKLAIENLADCDEDILEKYLGDERLEWDSISKSLIKYSRECKIIPVLASIAKNDEGTVDLLNAITQFFSVANNCESNELGALVFKVEHDKTLGRIAHVRVFSGSLKARDTVCYSLSKTEEKIAQLRKFYTNKLESVDEIACGDVGVVSGLSTVVSGNVIGNKALVPQSTIIQNPVLTVRVLAKSEAQYAQLAEALSLLNAEDPSLDFKWYKSEKEFHLKLMGKIQMEILENILEERFGIETQFTDPTVIYKETPKMAAEGFAKYTMPKPCWAIVKFKIEPGEIGSGVTYESALSVDKIARKYQNEVEETIKKSLTQGIKGWEVCDIKITLIDGEDHVMHSNPGDFILATPMGIMDGLKNADTSLLEPMFNFEIKASEELLGAIASDLTTMRATFANPEFADGKFVLKGNVPVATSMDYSIKLNSITSGKGKIKLSFGGYQKCSDELGVIKDYIGVNPLDRSQWILHKRGAFKADERKM